MGNDLREPIRISQCDRANDYRAGFRLWQEIGIGCYVYAANEPVILSIRGKGF